MVWKPHLLGVSTEKTMTPPSAGVRDDDDTLGQGPERCRNVGMRTVMRLMDRLVAASGLAPLNADDIRREIALFCKSEDAELVALFKACHDGCRKGGAGGGGGSAASKKRLHAFERAVIARFEKRFNVPTPEGHQLSRRAILGFMYALTKALGADTFRSFDLRARSIATSVKDGDPTDDPRMHEVVNGALVEMARAFEGEFLVALKQFTDLVNTRLSAPNPKSWDAEWELNRPLAVMMLDDLYAELRSRLVGGELVPAVADMLTPFFEGLDAARKLVDRPWLKRQLTP
jgi:hypothetical protein